MGECVDSWPRPRTEALWSHDFDIYDIDVCDRIDRMQKWRSDTHFAQPHASVYLFQMVSVLGQVSKLHRERGGPWVGGV